ncbi:RHS repeat-associated core domain-containing protein [Budvicia aquatica]|uniref:RHS repeat-associated core domain-containing protein n=1 Tax=Budvicia aquatica TaxID=82979 RepID=UPI0020833912|nr:RHS repeat-associated core domain-containing protein [Budvicia aquatica]GKX50341.1 type IV secretion protein Rhs [Budvicia aquatica]
MSTLLPEDYNVDAALSLDDEDDFALFVKIEQILGYDTPGFTDTRLSKILEQYRQNFTHLEKSALEVYQILAKRSPNKGYVNLIDITRNIFTRNKQRDILGSTKTYTECPLSGIIHFKYGVQFKAFVPLGNLTVYFTPVTAVQKPMPQVPYNMPSNLTITVYEPDGEPKKLTLNADGEVDFKGEPGKKYLVEVEPLTSEEDVKAWVGYYKPCIDSMLAMLESQWQESLLPEWQAYLAMDYHTRYAQCQAARRKGFLDAATKSISEVWDDFSGWIQDNSVYLRAGAEAQAGYISPETTHDLNVKFEEKLKAKEDAKLAPLPLTIQDEPAIFFHVYAMQCWRELLPPHMAAYISGEEMYKITVAVLEFIILFALGEAAFAVAGRTLSVIKNAVSAVKDARTAALLEKSLLSMSENITLSDKSRKAVAGAVSREGELVSTTNGQLVVEKDLVKLTQIERKADDTVEAAASAESSAGSTATTRPKTEGDPVSMQTGEELLQLDDAILPGLFPLSFSRLYRTSAVELDCGFGPGWSHSLSHSLVFTPNGVIWRNHEGLLTTFPEPEDIRPHIINPLADAAIYREPNGHDYILAQASGMGFYHFRRDGEQGILTAISDSHGNRLEVHYDATRRLSSVGRIGSVLRLAFLYDDAESQHICAVQLQRFYVCADDRDASWQPVQTSMQYGYNDLGQMVSAANAAGETEQYRYDEQHRIMQRTMAGGAEFYWEWEGEGKYARCVRHWGNFNALDHSYQWNDENRTVTVVTGKAERRVYQHSTQARLLSKTEADGSQTRYEYDDKGRLLMEIAPEGGVTRFEYDGQGQKVAEHFPDGRSRFYCWSAGHICRVDEGQRTWRYLRNSAGDLTAAINPLQQKTSYRYNEYGQRTEAHYPNGVIHRWLWGDEGELLEESRTDGEFQRYAYDDLMRVIGVEDGAGNATGYSYDDMGRIREVRLPDGAVRAYRYNAYGKVTWLKDEAGNITTYEYAAPLHLLTKKIQPDGNTLKYRYDNDHLQVSEIENQKGEVYRLSYTPTGLLSEEIGFDNVKTTYRYNADGKLTEKWEYGDQHDEVPFVTVYQRDTVGRLIKKVLPDGSEEHYHYDRYGQLTKVTDSQDNVLVWEYNELGQLTAEHTPIATQRYRYDALTGELIMHGLPGGQRLEYRYIDGQLRGMTLDESPLVAQRYDNAGRVMERRQGNALVTRYGFDARGRLTHQYLQQGFDDEYHPQTLWRQNYRYTQDGELAVVEGHNARTYHYDANGRLETAATPSTVDADRHAGRVEVFHYDTCGNRVIDEAIVQSELVPSGGERYSPPAQGNRLHRYGNRRFEYDRFGNLIAERSGKLGALTTYEYDCRHRLIKHVSPNGTVTTYTYDPFNRRTSKNSNGELTEFIWQGNKLVAQTRNHHRDWQTFIYELGTHRPLALIGGHKRDNPYKELPKVYWYQLDHLGTPQGLTDIQGQMVYTCEYDAYGKLRDEWFLQNEDSGERLLKLRNPLRFQGQYEDEESGLFYNLNRYYDPSLGRYLTQDPVKLAGGLNSYVYVDGGPVKWVDPLGLKGVPGGTEQSPGVIAYSDDNIMLDYMGRPVSARTQAILDKFQGAPRVAVEDELGHKTSVYIVNGLNRNDVKVSDLGKLQAATGNEFSLLRAPGGERVLIQGQPNQVGIPEKYLSGEWKWSGHSHPSSTTASEPDRIVLSIFGQEKSVIKSAKTGEEKAFTKDDDMSGWLPGGGF